MQFNEKPIISYNENSYFDNNYEIGDEKGERKLVVEIKNKTWCISEIFHV